MFTYIVFGYATIALIWAIFAIRMYFKHGYHENHSTLFNVLHLTLTFIVNFTIWPVAIVVAIRRKMI